MHTSPDRLRRLYGIIRSLNSIIQLDKLLNQIMSSAAELMGAEGGSLLLVTPDGRNLTFRVACGPAADQLVGITLPINDRSVVGVTALLGTPYIENDTANSPFFSGQVDKKTGYTTRKLLSVPLKVQGNTIGVVELVDKLSGQDFNAEDVELLEVLADAAAIAIENARLYEEQLIKAEQLEQAYDELKEAHRSTLQTLAGILDARDDATHGHSRRVVTFTMKLAKMMGITDRRQLKSIEQGALLHDVGKIGIADAVLRKPGPLTPEEWAEMRRHPEIGYKLLKNLGFLRETLPIVRFHHENWDGSGYPCGLRGEDIPLEARIFSVVDAYDAITSDRPYSPARSYEEARDILIAESGVKFDPRVVQVFLMVPPHEWQRLREASNGVAPAEASMVYHLYATGPLSLFAPMNSLAE
ncbi:MAG: HD domain-containing protein [Chloroflexota bacterium]|nr:HD domain-containing protein [Chloroflexota bacterium]MDQ5865770.1 HD domain-containing protein [Chloroflexota bacterium]